MSGDTQQSAAALASKFINSTSRSVFLTGKAGTGKTTFLRHIIRNTYKNALIVAPTGIAAINAGGVTIHSLFQLPFGAFLPVHSQPGGFQDNIKVNTIPGLLRGLQLNAVKRKLLQEMELLIIDEVSMLRADLLDAMDHVLKHIRRKSHLPFGGVQVLFIGDMLQLPPVVKEQEWRLLKAHYRTAYFFDAKVLQQHKPLYIELDKIYRQSDSQFISILNNLRSGHVSASDIAALNMRYKPDFKPGLSDNYIQLTTHNSKADSLNREALLALSGESFFFRAVINGDFSDNAFPVDENLELKKGAQIMFIKNDPTGAQRFFNGRIGHISAISASSIEVSFNDDSKPVLIERYTWENIRYSLNEATGEIEEKTEGTFTQYPIKLAWAITVHKSQGLTFEKAIIDIGRAFAPGQVYVALSRLTSLEGLVLSSPINLNSLQVDDTITEFSGNRESTETLEKTYEEESLAFFKSYILQCFSFTELIQAVKAHAESYQKDDKRSSKQKHAGWAAELRSQAEEARQTADKFLNQLRQIFQMPQEEQKEQLQKRVLAAKEHFSPILKALSGSIQRHITAVSEEKKTKAYLQELSDLDLLFFRQLQLISKAEAMVRSAAQNTAFSKESIHASAENSERTAALSASDKGAKSGKKERGKKEPRINTKELSYTLYKAGKTPEQIAEERKMSAVTIEGHLAHYVGLGMIDPKQFVTEEKLNNIIKVSEVLHTSLFSPIRQALGDEYSYSEIRFAMAYYLNSARARE